MFTNVVSLLALLATATASNVTGPWSLHITGKTNTTIDGYAGACHAGAAIEGLCYTTKEAANLTSNFYQYFYNYSGFDAGTGTPYQPGQITWLLQLTNPDGTIDSVPSALYVQPSWGSNVGVALFNPGIDGTRSYFSSYPDNGTLYQSYVVDDSNLGPTQPQQTVANNLTNFHLCWQYTGGYYYQSIAWVFSHSAPPQNPSCQPVDLSLVEVK